MLKRKPKTNMLPTNHFNDATCLMLAGDWHGRFDWALKVVQQALQAGVTTILHVGDFGIYPDFNVAALEALDKALGDAGIRLFIIRGNHEDYDYIENVVEDGLPRTVPVVLPGTVNIFLLPKVYFWETGGKRMLAVGGANSIDKFYRLELESYGDKKSWWDQEQIFDTDVTAAIKHGAVDYMFAHDAPLGVVPGLNPSGWDPKGLVYAEKSSEQITKIVDVVKPKLYFHGHYHIPYEKVTQATTYRGLDMEYKQFNTGVLNVIDDVFVWNK